MMKDTDILVMVGHPLEDRQYPTLTGEGLILASEFSVVSRASPITIEGIDPAIVNSLPETVKLCLGL